MATITITAIHAMTQKRYTSSTTSPKLFFTVSPRMLRGAEDPILEQKLYRLGYQNGIKSMDSSTFPTHGEVSSQ